MILFVLSLYKEGYFLEKFGMELIEFILNKINIY